MGSNTKQLCRLCYHTSNDVVNIWEIFLDSTIASILAKHFWFEVDGLTESVCKSCWMKTKSFHEFYRQVEDFQKCFRDESVKDESVRDATIHVERTVIYLDFEPDLNIDKREEVEAEVKSETYTMPVSSRNSSEYNEDNMSDEMEQVVGDECASNAQKELELEGQIRDLFSMNCENCPDVTFGKQSEARQHYRKYHGTCGHITCCDKKFHQRSRVIEHIRHHANLSSNSRSEQVEKDAEIRNWFSMKCEICTDHGEFQTLLEVKRHYRKIHNTPGYLTCCDKKFHIRYRMMDHIRWHTNSEAYSCECGRSFHNKTLLKAHMKIHFPLDSRRFKCSLCSRVFVAKSSLDSHVQYHHTPAGETFSCQTCGKNFRSSVLLSSHIRQVHELTADYVCEMCARKFKSDISLKNHIDWVHSTTPPAKVQCEICGVWLKCLRQHRLLHMETKPVNCPICNKEISSKRAMRRHIQNVHGEKGHQCQLCDKAFKCAKKLKEHLAVHTGKDLYDCLYCDKKFKSSANMYKHRKSMHRTEWTRDKMQNCRK